MLLFVYFHCQEEKGVVRHKSAPQLLSWADSFAAMYLTRDQASEV
jgi:hypothetical protein